MTQAALQIVTPADLSAQVEKSALVGEAQALTIQAAEQVETAKGIIRQIKERRNKIDTTFDSHIKSAHAAHKALVATKKGFTDELDQAEQIIKNKIGGFELEQRRLKDEADRKAREEAEAERGRILMAAQQKLQRIMKASDKLEDQIADLKRELIEGNNTDAQREFLGRQMEILQLKLDGQQEKAAEVQRQAEAADEVLAMPAPASTSYERVKGVRVVLIPEVADKMAVIKAVAAGQAPESALAVDMSAVKKLVNMGVKIPGIITREDTSVSVR